MRLTPQQYASLNRILGSADGQELYAILTNELQTTLKHLITARDADLTQLQGRAALLDELTRAFNDAPVLRVPKAERDNTI